MLIEFRVKNFKSLRDDTLFSLNASSDQTLAETNLLGTGIKSLPNMVASAAILGPNGSGKSNLINAMAYFQRVVSRNGTLAVNGELDITSFSLDENTKEAPSEFEITFLLDGVRYQYGFVISRTKIIDEWLLVYKSSKPQQWFDRSFDEEKEQYHHRFSSSLKGPKSIWEGSTRNNSLFLSTAVMLNSEQLLPVYNWITQNIVFFGTHGRGLSHEYSTLQLGGEQSRAAVINFLKKADICIEDIQVSRVKGVKNEISINQLTGESHLNSSEEEFLEPVFVHKTDKGRATFKLSEESLGTQRLFSLAGPILDILNKGKVLVFDELDTSLHALLAKKLVEMFQTPEVNVNQAQLIFSTHDTALLDKNLLRRDQVWFIEKDIDQASHLYPLIDFSPRKNESIEKGYLMGRYGAVPFFENALGL